MKNCFRACEERFFSRICFQNTLTDDYNRFIRITSQSSGQPGVNAQEYANYEISAPSFAEQQKIGLYFSYIDRLITLHQRKCDGLRKIKKLGENPFLDSYVMEFLDLSNEYHENDLRKALIRNPDCCCFPPPRRLITLHQRKVEELKDIKKFMLENMPFIDRVAFCIPTLI